MSHAPHLKCLPKIATRSAMLAAVLALAGCSSYVSPEEAKTKTVRNSKAAFKVLETAGVEQTVIVKSIAGQKVTGFNTNFFNMGFSGIKANMNVDVSLELGDTPSAQQIKSDGLTVFAYLEPRYIVHRQKAGRDSSYPVKRRLLLSKGVGSFCNGYYVLLNPQNGYKRTWNVNTEVELAEKTTGIDAGIWGSSLGSSDWRVADVDDKVQTRSMARSRTFVFPHGSRLLENCYADEGTKQAWLAAKKL